MNLIFCKNINFIQNARDPHFGIFNHSATTINLFLQLASLTFCTVI